MSLELILFLILALVAVASAAGMLLSRHAVYAALFLVLNFATVAVLYLFLNAPFIAMVQVTVYAGAIMVLFLFVIMLLGTEVLPPSTVLPWQRPLAMLLAVILFGETLLLLSRQRLGIALPAQIDAFSGPKAIGQALFNAYLLPFEITSILLLVAMVGAIVLTRKER
uniref:NADH-quinone oxidoreductase subunit J n=1 Tax=uncultured Chloroflexota bacterium TaxID=166587 RepID=H5S8R1_9CHLR|nr:NADH dehydrogenase I subunit J [uncultured Chloroflexota bacterium]